MKSMACVSVTLAALYSAAAWASGPTIAITPATDHPSGTIQISGKGFGANEAVDIYWNETDILLAVTDGTGYFTKHAYTLPAATLPGQDWVTGIGRKDGDAGQTPFTVSTSWASQGFDARNKRLNPYENVLSADDIASLDIAWTAQTGGGIESTPAVANGLVYIGSTDGKLYSFSTATGATVWSAATGGSIVSSPAVANGIVYVGSSDNKLYAFNASTGALKWTGLTGGSIYSSPTVSNGVVYVGSSDQQLWTFNAATGAKGWSVGTGGPIVSSPAVANGALFFGSDDGDVYAVNATTGSTLWVGTTSGAVESSPAVSNGVVQVGSDDDYLYSFPIGTGQGLRIHQFDGPCYSSSPGIAKKNVYLACGTTIISDGLQNWSWSFGAGAVVTSPAYANGLLYVPFDNYILAVDASTGPANELWSASLNNTAGPPVISDGVLYVGSLAGTLYAFELNGGNNALYKQRHTRPPARARLHPDYRLTPTP